MIGLCLMVYLSVHILTLNVPERRHEICPHALYFVKHGEKASWTANKRLICHIGAHDFYGDK